MNKQVGIWIRVSTEDQAKGESPEHHEARARMYAEVKGWEVVEIYHLEAVSGKAVLHHPEAEKMMRDISKGKITGLIFSKIARLARNTKELLQIADWFREYNADLISLQESIDTSTPAGRFFYTLLSAMAQWEREEIADRISASIPIRAKLGKPLGGAAQFGYKWENKKLVINEEEASVRRLLYDLFLEHKRRKTVAHILNERGYRTRKNAKFSDTTVTRLLEDPVAKGIRRANYSTSTGEKKHWAYKNKTDWVFHECPAIISEEKWDRIQAILAEQSNSRNQSLNKKTNIFTGYITCICGAKMYIHSDSPKYTCPKCKNKIHKEDIEEIFHQQLTSYIISENSLQDFLVVSETTIKDKEEQIKTLNKEAQKIKQKLDNLLELHLKKQIATEGFGDQYNPLFEQKKQIEKQIPVLEGEILALKQNEENSKYIFSEAKNLYTQWNTFSQEKKRDLVESITDSIIVDKEEVTINLKYIVPISLNPPNGQQNYRDS